MLLAEAVCFMLEGLFKFALERGARSPCGCRGVLNRDRTHPSTPLERGIAQCRRFVSQCCVRKYSF